MDFVKEVNKRRKKYCHQNDHDFVDNNNIGEQKLKKKRKLHLNIK